MIFQAVGKKENPAVLFFHAMGGPARAAGQWRSMLDTIVEKNTLPELPFLSE